MANGFTRLVERVLIMTSQQLALCCNREMGNIPSAALRGARQTRQKFN